MFANTKNAFFSMNTWPGRHAPCQTSWTPMHITHKESDETFNYVFECYSSKSKRKVYYRCIKENRSIKDHYTARAYIIFNEQRQKYDFFLVQKHTCNIKFPNQKPFYSEPQILNKVCELYNDKKFNRLPDMIFNALLVWINETTPIGAVKNTVSPEKIRNYVHHLNMLTGSNVISIENSKTLSNERFVLFQISCGKGKAIGFSSNFMLSLIPESTFFSAPADYSQLCIFLGRTQLMNVLLLFLLLSDKMERTYSITFGTFKLHFEKSGNRLREDVKFVCDFELSEINAIKKIFIDDKKSIQLCYFHFSHTIEKNFKKIFGNNAEEFEKDLMKIILLLPLISKESAKKFIEFLPSISNINQKINSFINYFISNYYKNEYSIDDWNISGKPFPDRATNN